MIKINAFAIAAFANLFLLGFILENSHAAESTKGLSAQELKFFESAVRPLLIEHCYDCHSIESGASEGGLRLDDAAAIAKGGKSGPIINRSEPRRSLMLMSIRHQKPAIAMPPPDGAEPLREDEIRTLEKWIFAGAFDPRTQTSKKKNREASDASDESAAAGWWSFQPLDRSALGDTKSTDISKLIDLKIAESQRAAGTSSIATASSNTLLRRISYDLTGLPPTIEQADAFDLSVNRNGLDIAYADLVDRLLASEQFGMHWGRHWLDVARFAESAGRDSNQNYPHAWRYRDWVIDSINEDMPYDQFIARQIAGDLLPAKSQAERSHNKIATGFLAVGSRSLNEQNPRQFALDQADEQIDTVFQATMSLTMACARCHDHKFDPISQRDYTAVAGIFLSTQTNYGTLGKAGMPGKNVSELISLPNDLGFATVGKPKTAAEVKKLVDESVKLEKQLAEQKREILVSRRANKNVRDDSSRQLIRSVFQSTNELMRMQNELQQYSRIDGSLIPLAMGVSEKPQTDQTANLIRTMRKLNNRDPFTTISDSPLFVRGELELAGEDVARNVPRIFDAVAGTSKPSRKYDIPESASGRLQLARWIVSRDNPMMARVAVNRTWTWLTGQPFVASVDNFGTSGSLPTHPELLDALAANWIDTGASQKSLIRSIVLSQTYRRSSRSDAANVAIDPDNTTYWRASSKRLSAEEVYDSILLAADAITLEPQVGSEIARIGDGVNRLALLKVKMPAIRKNGDRSYAAMIGRQLGSIDRGRAVYLGRPRDNVSEIFDLFDAPDAAAVCGQREVTNVPSQSLYLLNSTLIHHYGNKIAETATKKSPDTSIEFVFRTILCRRPSAAEIEQSENFLLELKGDRTAAFASLTRALLATAEFRYLD